MPKGKSKKEIRICPVCKISFKPQRKDKLCCSKKCTNKHWQANNKDKQREYRRKFVEKYPNNWKKYVHSFLWRKERNCLICKTAFMPKTNNQKFCSQRCQIHSAIASKKKRNVSCLKMRFRILARDNFTCLYCGRKPPECILEVDHKHPKGRGGKSRMKNYITSCRECNRGKGDILLKAQNIKKRIIN